MQKVKLVVHSMTESLHANGSQLIFLREVGGKRELTMVIGQFEANAISTEIDQMKPARPLTHDLLKSVMRALQVDLEEVLIHDLKEGVFFSQLHCKRGSDQFQFDSRTSDAIAMAVRFKCPIFTYEKILQQAGTVIERDEFSFDLNQADTSPDQPPANPLLSKRVEELKELLQQALDNEDYEKAAEIRDELSRRLLD